MRADHRQYPVVSGQRANRMDRVLGVASGVAREPFDPVAADAAGIVDGPCRCMRADRFSLAGIGSTAGHRDRKTDPVDFSPDSARGRGQPHEIIGSAISRHSPWCQPLAGPGSFGNLRVRGIAVVMQFEEQTAVFRTKRTVVDTGWPAGIGRRLESLSFVVH